MTFRKSFVIWAIAGAMMLSAKSATADSMMGMIGSSSTYYYGFDREAFDGTVIDGVFYPGATTVTVAGSDSESSRMAFLTDPAISAGFFSGTEDFETAVVNNGDGMEPAGSISLSFGGTGVTGLLTPDGGRLTELITGGHKAGRYPTSGTKFVETDVPDSETELTVIFDKPVVGFGFYATDSGDFDGRLKLIITQVDGGGTSNIEFTLPSPSGDLNRFPDDIPVDGPDYNASLLFFGLVDVLKPVTAVTIVNVPDGIYFDGDPGPPGGYDDDNYGFDDFIAVTAVPEPATFGLLLLGGTAVLGYSRRRSRSNVA